MSTSFRPNIRTYKAGGTINPYRAVKFNPDNNTVVQAGLGDKAIGVSQNDSIINSGQMVEVAMPGGGMKWSLGTTLTAPGPNSCKSDANGQATKAASGDWAVGHIYDGGVLNDNKEGYVLPHYTGATQS